MMNKNQRLILIAVVAVVVAMFIYPPFQAVRGGTIHNMGYGWIFALSKRGYMTINVSMLLIQWIGVFIVGGIAFFLAKGMPTEESYQKKNVLADTSSYDDARLKSNNVSDHQIPSDKISWWNWKSLLLACIITVVLYMIFLALAEATNTTKPSKNLGWTILWMYTTIEAWKFWKWKALLPYLIYMIPATIAGLIMDSAFVMAALNIGGLIIFNWLLYRPGSKERSATSVSKDAEIENIIREAELKSTQKFQKIAITKSETKQQDEEFIALLKSSINENGLKTIPGDDLIEIYKRAKSIESSYGIPSLALSETINAVLEEIKKRGLSPENKRQKIYSYNEL